MVALLAGLASGLYSGGKVNATTLVTPVTLHFQEDNQMFISDDREPVLSMYWGGTSLSTEITSELTLLGSLDSSLMQVKELLPETLAIHVITTCGIGKYYTNNNAALYGADHLPRTTDFDLRDGAPLTIYTELENVTVGVRWTSIYKDDVTEGLMVTASGPIFDAKGDLRGIVCVDLPLDTIVRQILEPDQFIQGDEGQILLCLHWNTLKIHWSTI